MQYAYLKNNWDAFSGSLLLLNTGFQEFNNSGDSDGTSGLQTIGTHLGYKKGKIVFETYIEAYDALRRVILRA